MATGVIGEVHVFQTLFTDATGAPLAVDNPTISVFNFTTLGVKQVLATAIPTAQPEVGRYTYPYTLPTALRDGSMLYAEMSGEDPITGDTLRYTQEVDVITVSSAGGMISTVVKPL